MTEGTRQLAAIMFTDMVGYTALMQENEVQAKENRDRHRQVLQESVREHQGEILQYYGDGTLIIFNSALEAIKSATDIQTALQIEPKIPLRVGIHTGDIVYDQDGIFGDGVNVASRIENLSVSGSILISEKVNDEIKNHPEFSTKSLGKIDLKNVKQPVEVFALTSEGLSVPELNEIKDKNSNGDKTIAVLPFVNMSADPENEYFSDGITEEILNVLTKVPGLQVTSRTSTFALKGKDQDIRDIGRQLNVKSVLEGSVRKSGDKVRITAQLINSADGYHIWSETYDRKLEDIFEVQDEISFKIANKLRENFNVEQKKDVEVKKPVKNIKAFSLYLKGRFHCNKWKPKDTEKAVEYYKEAMAIEPDFALAYTGMADCYTFLGACGVLQPKDAFTKSREFALKSLELDPDLVESHLAMANIYLWHDWDFKAAKKSLDKALEINPNSAMANLWTSMYYIANKEIDKAFIYAEKAMLFDPLSPLISRAMGMVYFCMEKYDEALEQFEKSIELDPTASEVMLKIAWTLALKGDLEKSLQVLRENEQLINLSQYHGLGLGHIGYVYAKMGNTEEATKYIKMLEEKENENKDARLNFEYAVLYYGLNDLDKTFEHLEKAVEEKVGAVVFMNADPLWKDLWNDPRFKKLVEKIGLD